MNVPIAKPTYIDTVLYKDGDTADIMTALLKEAKVAAPFTAQFASRFSPDRAGMKALWAFVKNNIPYKEDPPDVQWIQTPARVWDNRKIELGGTGKGADCKSYTLFIISVLQNLGVDFTIRFVGYSAFNQNVTHVYPIAKIDGRAIIVDSVWDRFDSEKKYKFKKDYNMAQIVRLAGVKSASIGIPKPCKGGVTKAPNQEYYRKQVEFWKNQYVKDNKGLLYLYTFLNPEFFQSKFSDTILKKRQLQRQHIADKTSWWCMDLDAHREGLQQGITKILTIDPVIYWIEKIRQFMPLTDAGIAVLNQYYGKEVAKPITPADTTANFQNIDLKKKGGADPLKRGMSGIWGDAENSALPFSKAALTNLLKDKFSKESSTWVQTAATEISKLNLKDSAAKNAAIDETTATVLTGFKGAMSTIPGGGAIADAVLALSKYVSMFNPKEHPGSFDTPPQEAIPEENDFEATIRDALKDGVAHGNGAPGSDGSESAGTSTGGSWLLPVAVVGIGAYFLFKK